MGQFANHSFEKLGVSIRTLERPDGKIWVIYEQPEDGRNVTNRFDPGRLFKTAILSNSGEHLPGSDRLFEIGNRFTFGFFAMATQADNKLLLGTETGDFFRLNADGSRDTSFNPEVTQTVGAVVVQSDGKIVVVPEMVRLAANGTKDPSFSSPLSNASPGFVGLQSDGKIVVSVDASPYLQRLKSDGSIDATFLANLSSYVYSGLMLPDDAILLRLYESDSNGGTTFTLVRLLADGSVDPSFHPDPRLDNWYAAQSDGKVLAGFRDPVTSDFFLGRMNANGALDSSYQTYPVGQGENNSDPISAVFIQPDGSILAEIISASEGQQFLRFSSSGVLDPASKVPFRIPGAVTKLVAQTDGELLVSGDFNFVDGAKTGPLIRVENDGNLDPAFHPPTFAFPSTGFDLDLQSSGSILFSLRRTDNGSTSQVRLLPDGSLDPSFALQNLGPRFKVRSDDKIVTAHFDNVVRRLLSDGNADPGFSPIEFFVPGTFGNSIEAFAIQTDGKIVVIGNGILIGGIHSVPVRSAVVRLNPDGGIDSTFQAPSFNFGTRFNCVAVQNDGKILLGGRFGSPSPSANLVRLNSDGSIDSTFFAATDYTVSAILVENSGTILIGGAFSTVNGQPASRVARLQPTGQLDPTFDLDTGGGAVFALAVLADGRIVAGGEFGLVATAPAPPSRLRNISTRMFVDAGDNALIGGITVTGTGEKKLLIRGIGPSLANAGINGALEDPILELHDSHGALLASNDDWGNSPDQPAISNTTIPPSDPKEAAVVATVPANGSTYTAVVRPARGASGIGLVEVYDLDADTSSSKLANISARGNVLTGDRAMIGGFIVAGPAGAAPTRVVVRALGPSIPLSDVLHDPTLELHQGSPTLATNDDWKQSQQFQIEQTTIPPNDDRESALVQLLQAASPVSSGTYTAIVRGKNNTSGIGLLEIYDITK